MHLNNPKKRISIICTVGIPHRYGGYEMLADVLVKIFSGVNFTGDMGFIDGEMDFGVGLFWDFVATTLSPYFSIALYCWIWGNVCL